MSLRILTSKRFLKSYNRGIVLQGAIEHTVHDFVARYRADPVTAVLHYNRAQRLKKKCGVAVLEMDVTGGPRMLGHWEPPCLTLVDVGKHEIMDAIDCRDVSSALRSREQAPSQFWPSTPTKFFTRKSAKSWAQYANEWDKSWLYFLDEQQDQVATAIYMQSLECLTTTNQYQIHHILGGPGTGKTSILLNLLKRFNDDGIDAKLILPDSVKEYVKSASPINVKPYEVDVSDQSPCDILLVDDPESLDALIELGDLGPHGLTTVLVFAFDPLQLDGTLADSDYAKLVRQHDIELHTLETCYRQKENVGIQAKHVFDTVARSTPFYRDDKKQSFTEAHAQLTKLSNEITFPNPDGDVELHENATQADLLKELKSIKEQPGGLWKHWPPLLVAVIDKQLDGLPPTWRDSLLRTGVPYRYVAHDEILTVKGVEFQHAFIVMGKQLYDQINLGFEGSGRRVYEALRLLRIPYSRAKDRLVVFVLPPKRTKVTL